MPEPRLNSRWSPLPACLIALLLACAPGHAQEEPAAESGAEAPAAAPAAETPAVETSAAEPAPAEPAPTVPIIPVEIPPELKPYNVLVSISCARQPSLDDRFRADLLSSIESRISTWFGPGWTLTVAADTSAAPVAPDSLHRATSQQLNERYLPGEHDKVFLVAITQTGGRYDLAVREWDRSSQTAGHVATEQTFDRRLCADAATRLVHRVFRPLAMVTDVNETGDQVELAIRAGEFLAGDEDALPFRVGEYLTPYYRYLDRQREVRQIQHTQWTFLRVESIERARITCSVISTFRAPISGGRRRVELMGIAARPLFEQTNLRISPRNAPDNPLVGYRVDVMDRMPTVDDAVEDRITLATNRAGIVVIPAFPDEPLRHLLVHSGKSVLATLPLIPGLEPDLELSTPDDTARLNVEGALAVLEGDLIDIVARRAVLMARARIAAKQQKWAEADEYIRQLEALPDLERVQQQIAAIRLPAVQTARILNNRAAETRIRRMCAELEEVAAQHLDLQKLRDFQAEIAELRAAGGGQ